MHFMKPNLCFSYKLNFDCRRTRVSMLYFLGGKCAIHVFSWREITQEMVWASVTIVVTLKHLLLWEIVFKYFIQLVTSNGIKSRKKARKKRRRNLRNLSEESLEGSSEGEEENISVKNKTLHHYCGDSPH